MAKRGRKPYKHDRDAEEIIQQAETQQLPVIADLIPTLEKYNLTPAATKVLAVNSLPQCTTMTIKDRAALAGVSVRHWWTVTRTDSYRKALIAASRELLTEHVPEILRSYIKRAKNGDVVAAARILEQVGVLERLRGADVNTTVNVAIVERERQQTLQTGLQQFGYTIVKEETPGEKNKKDQVQSVEQADPVPV